MKIKLVMCKPPPTQLARVLFTDQIDILFKEGWKVENIWTKNLRNSFHYYQN